MKEKLEAMVQTLRPSLVMQGRDIALVEATEERIALNLSGFCGDCGCSQEYVEGLQEMLEEAFPNVQVVVNKV